jgi:hypothetical protein
MNPPLLNYPTAGVLTEIFATIQVGFCKNKTVPNYLKRL